MAQRVDDYQQMTLEEYEALPEDDRYFDEVSRGFLVREPTPGDAHGRLVTLISYRLMQYVDTHPQSGRVYSEAGFVLAREPLTLRRPDVAFVRMERVPRGYAPDIFRGAPDLAVEVVSTSNRASALLSKISELLEAGTPVVWIVDPAKETAVIHDQSGTPRVLLRADGALEFPELLPGFSLDLARLFAEY